MSSGLRRDRGRAGRWTLLALLLGLLAGCGAPEQDLPQWMAAQRARVKPSIEPIQPPGRFEAEPYSVGELVEPFSNQKLAAALRQEANQASSLLASELNRRREPLESFPLDNMTMVGSLVRQGRPYALLKVGDLLYQVQPGNYIGQNYGKITRISETELALREIVQDAAGEWIERVSTLQIQDRQP